MAHVIQQLTLECPFLKQNTGLYDHTCTIRYFILCHHLRDLTKNNVKIFGYAIKLPGFGYHHFLV